MFKWIDANCYLWPHGDKKKKLTRLELKRFSHYLKQWQHYSEGFCCNIDACKSQKKGKCGQQDKVAQYEGTQATKAAEYKGSQD